MLNNAIWMTLEAVCEMIVCTQRLCTLLLSTTDKSPSAEIIS